MYMKSKTAKTKKTCSIYKKTNRESPRGLFLSDNPFLIAHKIVLKQSCRAKALKPLTLIQPFYHRLAAACNEANGVKPLLFAQLYGLFEHQPAKALAPHL